MERKEPETVVSSSMGRGFAVVSALALLTRVPPHRATVGEIAAALGRERSQVSRTLKSLHDFGLVVRADDLAYQLSWEWYATAQELTSRRLLSDGVAVLDALAAEIDEPCFLGVLRGDSTVTIAESIPASSRIIGSWIGRAYPAFCSDAGQATLWDASDDEVRAVFSTTAFGNAGPNAPTSIDDFLARLDAARCRGFAVIDEEAERGLFAVSAPVRDFRGEVVSALQIVGERDRLQPRVDALSRRCLVAADDLSGLLAFSEPS
jgi:IclR family transcriptional regulator, pca regulon regulatory protein